MDRLREASVPSYLRLDVDMLADVFSRWRAILREKYSFDMVDKVNLPGYAFLLKTRTKPDLVSDPCLTR